MKSQIYRCFLNSQKRIVLKMLPVTSFPFLSLVPLVPLLPACCQLPIVHRLLPIAC